MAGTTYNTEVLDLATKCPEALNEVIEISTKGAQAVLDSAAQVGSPKFTVVAEELDTNVKSFVKVANELLAHIEEYIKTYKSIEDAF